ncbi:MAG: Crp/Fnr family transcriptional regulator [Treponema sp.]|jgi:CRP-like cAMP-binding protein|nr:Crp/Fnr family transcriptional regulator [Treponema sp.]
MNLFLLRGFPLFEHINESELHGVLTCLGARNAVYDKGSFISLSGDTLRYIGVIESGCVHMIKEDLWGGKSILMVLRQGELFGESFICSQTFAANVSFQAAANSTILFLPFNRVLRSCSKTCIFHQRMIENMVTLIALKNIRFIEKLDIISKKSIREKLLTFLSQEAQAAGTTTITLALGRLDLAAYLGVDRSALTRELARMKGEGLLDYQKNTYTLYKQ